MATLSFPTISAIERMIGEIKGFDMEPGGYYDHADGIGHIDGTEVLERILQEIPGIEATKVTPELTEVTISTQAVKEFMEGSGFRSMDYDEQAAVEDINSDPIGLLNLMRREFGVKVNPLDLFHEREEIEEPGLITGSDKVAPHSNIRGCAYLTHALKFIPK